MIVLNKKRITLILSGIFLSIFVFVLSTGTDENKYISTVSLPASGKTIVIDAGHGVPDEGAIQFSKNMSADISFSGFRHLVNCPYTYEPSRSLNLHPKIQTSSKI